ncbi:MAG TPA: phosphoribosylanthranilate isomerase [Reyranella sp.]|nr:phosphoribosylanthranilate isomerase [Reyranella sp.]
MTEAKICGLSTPQTVDAAVEAGADYVGFVAYPPSPRHIPTETLRALGKRVPGLVVRVGLFVDPDDALLDERVGTGALDMLQLHGSETPQRVADIKKRTGKLVMKAIKVGKASDVDQGIKLYGRLVDLLMFDTEGGELPGGNAKPFDWTVLSGRAVPVPWMLAGGLTPDNVAQAVRLTDAPIVDVSSGVEATRGVKSVDKIRAFLKRVHEID